MPPLSGATLDKIFCLSIPLPQPSPAPSYKLPARLSHLGIVRNVPRKPRRSSRGERNERRTIKVIVGLQDRLLSEFSSFSTPSPLSAEPDFKFSSGLQPHSDKRQHDHDTSATTPIFSPNDRDLTTSSLSAPVRPTRRQLLRIPFHPFSTENTLLVCLFNARSTARPGADPTSPRSFLTTISTSCC